MGDESDGVLSEDYLKASLSGLQYVTVTKIDPVLIDNIISDPYIKGIQVNLTTHQSIATDVLIPWLKEVRAKVLESRGSNLDVFVTDILALQATKDNFALLRDCTGFVFDTIGILFLGFEEDGISEMERILSTIEVQRAIIMTYSKDDWNAVLRLGKIVSSYKHLKRFEIFVEQYFDLREFYKLVSEVCLLSPMVKFCVLHRGHVEYSRSPDLLSDLHNTVATRNFSIRLYIDTFAFKQSPGDKEFITSDLIRTLEPDELKISIGRQEFLNFLLVDGNTDRSLLVNLKSLHVHHSEFPSSFSIDCLQNLKELTMHFLTFGPFQELAKLMPVLKNLEALELLFRYYADDEEKFDEHHIALDSIVSNFFGNSLRLLDYTSFRCKVTIVPEKIIQKIFEIKESVTTLEICSMPSTVIAGISSLITNSTITDLSLSFSSTDDLPSLSPKFLEFISTNTTLQHLQASIDISDLVVGKEICKALETSGSRLWSLSEHKSNPVVDRALLAFTKRNRQKFFEDVKIEVAMGFDQLTRTSFLRDVNCLKLILTFFPFTINRSE